MPPAMRKLHCIALHVHKQGSAALSVVAMCSLVSGVAHRTILFCNQAEYNCQDCMSVSTTAGIRQQARLFLTAQHCSFCHAVKICALQHL